MLEYVDDRIDEASLRVVLLNYVKCGLLSRRKVTAQGVNNKNGLMPQWEYIRNAKCPARQDQRVSHSVAGT